MSLANTAQFTKLCELGLEKMYSSVIAMLARSMSVSVGLQSQIADDLRALKIVCCRSPTA